MAKRKNCYPGLEEAERQRSLQSSSFTDDEPDCFGVVPNYEKFEKKGWNIEEILVWFNID